MPEGNSISAIIAFISIPSIKEYQTGFYLPQIIAALHQELRSCLDCDQFKDNEIEVLSALTGAILIIPSKVGLDTLLILETFTKRMSEMGIPIRIGLAYGYVVELSDIDNEVNYIGKPINIAARLSTSENNQGIFVHSSFAELYLGQIPPDDWLSTQKRKPITVKGKREEEFLCYQPSDGMWPSCNGIHLAIQSEATSSNLPPKPIIAYDLPGFSDGDTNQLSKRFRSVIYALRKTLTSGKIENSYLSPGGDGGVFILSDTKEKQAFNLAKEFESNLKIESDDKDSLISSDCRIGIHYGPVASYKNAKGLLRPTGLDIFIADSLIADSHAKSKGPFVFTDGFVDPISEGNAKLFKREYEEIPCIKVCDKTVSRYVERHP